MKNAPVRLILVGNAPSSGSTLLADIIDSAPFAACGPELEFFCNQNLCNFSEFQRDPSSSSYSATLRSTRIQTRWDHLDSYGFKKDEWIGEIKRAKNIDDFVSRFIDQFLKTRKKDPSGYVFEKTPQNVNTFSWFTEEFDQSKMVYLVRNPAFVVESLLNRGWGTYTAAATWLLNVALMWDYRNHPNLLWLRYEDLVKDPFVVVSDLLDTCCLGHTIDPESLKSDYESNSYRMEKAKHLDSWTTASDREVGNANEKELSLKTKKLLKAIWNMKVSKQYAKAYGVPELTMKAALDFFGYQAAFGDQIKEIQGNTKLPFSLNDLIKLSMKGIRSLFRKDGINKAIAPFSAVEECEPRVS